MSGAPGDFYFLGLRARDRIDLVVLVKVDVASNSSSLMIAREFLANLRTSLFESCAYSPSKSWTAKIFKSSGCLMLLLAAVTRLTRFHVVQFSPVALEVNEGSMAQVLLQSGTLFLLVLFQNGFNCVATHAPVFEQGEYSVAGVVSDDWGYSGYPCWRCREF